MANRVAEYLKKIQQQFETQQATEHSYMPALKSLLQQLLPNHTVINEPRRIECGAPDYILLQQNTPSAYIEAKDIGDIDLAGKKQNHEQFDRYKKALQYLIFTDYLDFNLYENGEFVEKARIAEIKSDKNGNKIVPIKENVHKFLALIERFGKPKLQTIESCTKLAEIIAGKARLLADVVEKSLQIDFSNLNNENNRNNENGLHENPLFGQLEAFKKELIHDIDTKTFSDIYAQTISYGMFAARFHGKNSDTFSRTSIAELIPTTNPFLREIFQYISGVSIDEQIVWIVDELVNIFRVTDIKKVMSGFGEESGKSDPVLHFYENFLSAYNPDLRKNRGVWYTPKPIVSYIISAVDEILQQEFKLSKGLADNSKVDVQIGGDNKVTKKIHKVQILDPATGTGTFLAEIVQQIHEKFKNQQGSWQGYVADHLIQRLHGFEVLMAPYTMAHLNLGIVLSETNYVSKNNERFQIYLTNSLEEHDPQTTMQFAQWISLEAREAKRIKKETPVVVVVANPPYLGVSSNKGKWISDLMDDYKKEPGTKAKLQERNSKWLSDDYCKFIRLGQDYVDINSAGILAYITNHSFLDNPTFRGMRWNLLQSFDKIYILDLHGNSKKKETCPDGSKDENVFNIKQGVSINIFIKTGKKKSGSLAKVYHFDLFGKRKEKYAYLKKQKFSKTPFVQLKLSSPEYFFVQKDDNYKEEYKNGFSVKEFFVVNNVGIVTMGDSFAISETQTELRTRLNYFLNNDILTSDFKEKYGLGKNYAAFILESKRNLVLEDKNFVPIEYRPFDTRWTYFDKKILWRPRTRVMQHFLAGENIGLNLCRQFKTGNDYTHVFVTNNIIESSYVSNKTSEITYVFPLYIYPENGSFESHREPNLKHEIVNKIADKIDSRFENEVSGKRGTFSPIDIFDYIYAVLHSPSYRKKYQEFLKVDFPRVPFPNDAQEFRKFAKIGGKLRKQHLMKETPNIETKFNVTGTNCVEKISWENHPRPFIKKGGNQTNNSPRFKGGVPEMRGDSFGKVWINDTQYFENVPQISWEFYIGGYQPAQKWLKDRKYRCLTFDEIVHYQRVIAILSETVKIMNEELSAD
ncbi:MAG: type ISP restriction/modification enzyme [Thermoguttaceae bacterium]